MDVETGVERATSQMIKHRLVHRARKHQPIRKTKVAGHRKHPHQQRRRPQDLSQALAEFSLSGIKDYDLGYYDASDLSYDAEDAVTGEGSLRRAAAEYGSRFATKLVCISGSRRNSASPTRRYRAPLVEGFASARAAAFVSAV